jgi:RNA polymerase sigma factor (sigma-70 family)
LKKTSKRIAVRYAASQAEIFRGGMVVANASYRRARGALGPIHKELADILGAKAADRWRRAAARVSADIALQKGGVRGARTFISTDDLDGLKAHIEEIGPRMEPPSYTERFRPKIEALASKFLAKNPHLDFLKREDAIAVAIAISAKKEPDYDPAFSFATFITPWVIGELKRWATREFSRNKKETTFDHNGSAPSFVDDDEGAIGVYADEEPSEYDLPSVVVAPREDLGRLADAVRDLRPKLDAFETDILDCRILARHPVDQSVIAERRGVSQPRVSRREAKLRDRIAEHMIQAQKAWLERADDIKRQFRDIGK